jgi:hypothetical protein
LSSLNRLLEFQRSIVVKRMYNYRRKELNKRPPDHRPDHRMVIFTGLQV